MIQVAIAMTCPKTPFSTNEEEGFPKGDFREPDVYKPAEITENELDNVRKMIKELGL